MEKTIKTNEAGTTLPFVYLNYNGKNMHQLSSRCPTHLRMSNILRALQFLYFLFQLLIEASTLLMVSVDLLTVG